MGAFLGLINRIGRFMVKRNDETCIHCKKCDKACPVNIGVSSIKQVQSSECIVCNECANACPVKDTLYLGTRKKAKIGAGSVVLVSVVLFAAVVAFASFTGGFEWKQKTIVETTTETGYFNPDEIRGSDTFRDVSEITGIDKKLFLKEFGLSEEEFELPIKDRPSRRLEVGYGERQGVRERTARARMSRERQTERAEGVRFPSCHYRRVYAADLPPFRKSRSSLLFLK